MIVITGATGFLGSYLIQHLAGVLKPSEILCLIPEGDSIRMAGSRIKEDELVAYYHRLGVKTLSYPVRGRVEDYQRALGNINQIDAVLYMAANNNQGLGFAVLKEDNVRVFENFIDALGEKLSGVPLIFTSSVMAYAVEDLEKSFGVAALEKIMPYGKSKQLAEKMLFEKEKKYHFMPLILRLGSVYGDRAATGLLKAVQGLAGLSIMAPIPAFPGRASVIHVIDVVDLLGWLLSSKHIPRGIFNVDDASPFPIGRLVAQTAEKNGKHSRQFRVPAVFLPIFTLPLRLMARLGFSSALGVLALFKDIYVKDDSRIWQFVKKTPLPFKEVWPPIREAIFLSEHKNKSKKIALLGASGFIGSRILKHLLEEGYAVRCSFHKTNYPEEIKNNLDIVACDTSDVSSLLSFLRGCDVAVYAAGLTTAHGNKDWQEYLRVNALGVANLMEVCRASGMKKLIFIGSQASHGNATGRYGLSKYLGEKIVEVSDVPWTILKPGQVIGQSGLVNTLYGLSRLMPVFPMPARTPANLELVGVDEMAQFIGKLVTDESGKYHRKIIYLGSKERISLGGLLELLWKKSVKRPWVFNVPRKVLAVASFFARSMRIMVPLTQEVLDGIYTSQPEFSASAKVIRECDDEPASVLERYL